LYWFGEPFEVFSLREIPEIKVTTKTILSCLEVDCEVLDNEWNRKVQCLSEKIPEQNTNVFPLESSEHHSEQNISGLFRFNGISPLFLELRKRSLKFLPVSKLSILNWRELFIFVGRSDNWIDPHEENFSATIRIVMSSFSLI